MLRIREKVRSDKMDTQTGAPQIYLNKYKNLKILLYINKMNHTKNLFGSFPKIRGER
jgi:hypothetical protein